MIMITIIIITSPSIIIVLRRIHQSIIIPNDNDVLNHKQNILTCPEHLYIHRCLLVCLLFFSEEKYLSNVLILTMYFLVQLPRISFCSCSVRVFSWLLQHLILKANSVFLLLYLPLALTLHLSFQLWNPPLYIYFLLYFVPVLYRIC